MAWTLSVALGFGLVWRITPSHPVFFADAFWAFVVLSILLWQSGPREENKYEQYTKWLLTLGFVGLGLASHFWWKRPLSITLMVVFALIISEALEIRHKCRKEDEITKLLE